MRWGEGYIAVDWGTTNRRAYAIGAAGDLEDKYEDALGVTAIAEGGFEAAIATLRSRLGDRPMLLAGMIGSNRGWIETPYIPCPAGPSELASAVRWVEPGRTGIVTGVSQSGSAGADVMRGEEVQAFGAIRTGLVPANSVICHPGTHAKWIRMSDGRIEAFRTMMTGEMFSLLRKHSILADMLRGTAEIDSDFDDGCAAALSGEPLLASLFAIRARRLVGGELANPASHASGLLIGSDVRAGLALWPEIPIALVGRPDLCALYRAALGEAGHQVAQVDGQEAFLAGIHGLTELF